MTTEEAIAHFKYMDATHISNGDHEALKLGIEAMQRVKAERTGYETHAPDLLPGETDRKSVV